MQVTGVEAGAAELRRWRCGRIVTEAGELKFVEPRWFAYTATKLRAVIEQRWRPTLGDRCELYYHQPHRNSQFLVLGYVRSGTETKLSSFYLATLVLDEIARIKQSQFIVAEVSNARISERLMHRWGWEKHCKRWFGRHYIKRFYGKYPALSAIWAQRLGGATKSLEGNG